MRTGDQRSFETKGDKCKLGRSTYYVRKVLEGQYYYFYASTDNNFNDASAAIRRAWKSTRWHTQYENQVGYSQCFNGAIYEVWVNNERPYDHAPINGRNCGMGTVLSFLCMIDEDIIEDSIDQDRMEIEFGRPHSEKTKNAILKGSTYLLSLIHI